MKKVKNKKLIILFFVLVISLFIFMYCYFSSHSYEIEYSVDNVKVIEKYDNDKKYYTFNLKYKDIDFNIISTDKYINKRKLINSIEVEDNSDKLCLNITQSLVSLYSFCYKSDKYYTYYYDESVEFASNDSYQNILIDQYNDKNYLLWNYHSFVYLDGKDKKNIALFDKDIYNINLYYQTDTYLIIPDYSTDYYFNKVYLINLQNGKVTNFDLRYEVAFDSYFLGDFDNKVYLYDVKNEVEYYLDLKKKDIYKTNYKIMENGNFINVSNQKLKNNKLKFTSDNVFLYAIDNNTLVMNNLIVDNSDDIVIVKQDGKDIYYIVGDTLYYFNPSVGKKTIFKYSEWNFNTQNMVFVS